MGLSIGRVSTGVPELDRMLDGGLFPGRPYIVSGVPGSGKSVLAMQFLINGVKNGENVLMVTMTRPPNEVRQNFSRYSNYDKISIFDAISDIMTYEKTPVKDIASVRSVYTLANIGDRIRMSPEFNKVEVSFTALQSTLKLETMRKMYDRIVIDSITALKYFCMEGYDSNTGIQSFLRFLSELKVTVLVIADIPNSHAVLPELFLSRGEIRMHQYIDRDHLAYAIRIEKYKGSSFDQYVHPYVITGEGIKIDLSKNIEIKEEVVVPPLPKVEAEKAEPEAEASAMVTAIYRGISTMLEDVKDLNAVGVDISDIRALITKAVNFIKGKNYDEAVKCSMEARQLIEYKTYVYNTTQEEKAKVAVEAMDESEMSAHGADMAADAQVSGGNEQENIARSEEKVKSIVAEIKSGESEAMAVQSNSAEMPAEDKTGIEGKATAEEGNKEEAAEVDTAKAEVKGQTVPEEPAEDKKGIEGKAIAEEGKAEEAAEVSIAKAEVKGQTVPEEPAAAKPARPKRAAVKKAGEKAKGSGKSTKKRTKKSAKGEE